MTTLTGTSVSQLLGGTSSGTANLASGETRQGAEAVQDANVYARLKNGKGTAEDHAAFRLTADGRGIERNTGGTSGGTGVLSGFGGSGGSGGSGGTPTSGGGVAPPLAAPAALTPLPGAPGKEYMSPGLIAPGMTNTAEVNPISNEIITELRNRKKGFGDLDKGIQDIRDRGIAGSKGSQLSRIARGVSGSGIEDYDAKNQGSQERNDINRMTTDFALGREKENYNESMGIAGLGLAQSGQQLQAQGQAAGQAATQQSLGLQAQQQANQLWGTQNSLQLQANQQAQQQANMAWQQQQQQAAAQQAAAQQNLQTLINLLS